MLKRLFFFGIVLTHSFNAFSQSLASVMEHFAQNRTSERLYLHFDKSTYLPGETIWFKAYAMKAILPATESKSVYFDVSDEKGNLLSHISAPLLEGSSFGQFDIPEEYAGEFLHIKAYTRWMLNFDSAFLYQKDLKILQEKPKSAPQITKPQIDFFPEGGSLVAGVVNKVAFKTTDQFGKPMKVTGVVTDQKGKIIDSILDSHDGLGYFNILPAEGETYTAKWTARGGMQQTTDLPKASRNNVTIKIGVAPGQRTFYIAAPSYPVDRHIEVLGTMFNQPVFNFTRTLEEGATQGLIPVEALPTGILVITVFDDQQKPLTERITFINNHESVFTPEVTVQHWGLNKRARNEVEIAVPDSLVSSLSVSVTDLGIDADTSDNIVSHLLLSSELRGRINNPAYYFQNDSDSLEQLLDLVMLTHGWRKYNWEQITRNDLPPLKYSRDTSFLTFSGQIYGASPMELQKPENNIVILFNEKGKPNNIVSLPIKPDGSFRDSNMLLFDSIRVYFQLPKSRGFSSASVKFMTEKFPALSNTTAASPKFYNGAADTSGLSRHFQISTAMQDELKFNQTKVLEQVTVERRKKSPVEILDEKYASGMFQGGDGYQFDLLNDPSAVSSFSIFNYLQGRVPGLQVNTGSNPPTLTWRGGAPGLYLDEMPTTSDFISSIPVSDIAYIKVIRPPFMGAMGGANGAIAIYSRRGGDIKSTGAGLANNIITGYTPIKQFFSPNYSSISPDHDKKDLRTTLYWNPEVVTQPGSNKALITFYNNDVTEAFRVVVQGMSRDGRLASVVYVME